MSFPFLDFVQAHVSLCWAPILIGTFAIVSSGIILNRSLNRGVIARKSWDKAIQGFVSATSVALYLNRNGLPEVVRSAVVGLAAMAMSGIALNKSLSCGIFARTKYNKIKQALIAAFAGLVYSNWKAFSDILAMNLMVSSSVMLSGVILACLSLKTFNAYLKNAATNNLSSRKASHQLQDDLITRISWKQSAYHDGNSYLPNMSNIPIPNLLASNPVSKTAISNFLFGDDLDEEHMGTLQKMKNATMVEDSDHVCSWDGIDCNCRLALKDMDVLKAVPNARYIEDHDFGELCSFDDKGCTCFKQRPSTSPKKLKRAEKATAVTDFKGSCAWDGEHCECPPLSGPLRTDPKSVPVTNIFIADVKAESGKRENDRKVIEHQQTALDFLLTMPSKEDASNEDSEEVQERTVLEHQQSTMDLMMVNPQRPSAKGDMLSTISDTTFVVDEELEFTHSNAMTVKIGNYAADENSIWRVIERKKTHIDLIIPKLKQNVLSRAELTSVSSEVPSTRMLDWDNIKGSGIDRGESPYDNIGTEIFGQEDDKVNDGAKGDSKVIKEEAKIEEEKGGLRKAEEVEEPGGKEGSEEAMEEGEIEKAKEGEEDVGAKVEKDAREDYNAPKEIVVRRSGSGYKPKEEQEPVYEEIPPVSKVETSLASEIDPPPPPGLPPKALTDLGKGDKVESTNDEETPSQLSVLARPIPDNKNVSDLQDEFPPPPPLNDSSVVPPINEATIQEAEPGEWNFNDSGRWRVVEKKENRMDLTLKGDKN